MAVETRLNRIATLLNRVKKYCDLVAADSFENQTLDDMKGNVKSILDEVKVEIDQIKAEVNDW